MARSRPPSFDFYADDFMAGTVHLPPAAVGCYIRLLCFQWSHGSIPNDPRQLAQITGIYTEEEKQMLSVCLSKFITTDDGRLQNERLEAERNKKLLISARRSEAGKLGGRPGKYDTENQTESKSKANAKQIESNEEAKQKPPNRKKEVGLIEADFDLEASFSRFWESYPQKNGKPSARKAFGQAINRLTKIVGSAQDASEKLVAAAQEYSQYLALSPSPPQPKYAQGWLNDERYDVDYTKSLDDDFSRVSRLQTSTPVERRLQGTSKAIEDFVNG